MLKDNHLARAVPAAVASGYTRRDIAVTLRYDCSLSGSMESRIRTVTSPKENISGPGNWVAQQDTLRYDTSSRLTANCKLPGGAGD